MRSHGSPGLARAEASSRGASITGVAHSLLTKSNERARVMGSLKRIRRRKMMAQGGRCYYCGLPMWDDAAGAASSPRNDQARRTPKALRCTAEHLHARADGGRDTDENIVAACWYCNNQRHKRKCPHSPEEHRLYVQKRMAAGKWLLAQVLPVGITATSPMPS